MSHKLPQRFILVRIHAYESFLETCTDVRLDITPTFFVDTTEDAARESVDNNLISDSSFFIISFLLTQFNAFGKRTQYASLSAKSSRTWMLLA